MGTKSLADYKGVVCDNGTGFVKVRDRAEDEGMISVNPMELLSPTDVMPLVVAVDHLD